MNNYNHTLRRRHSKQIFGRLVICLKVLYHLNVILAATMYEKQHTLRDCARLLSEVRLQLSRYYL